MSEPETSLPVAYDLSEAPLAELYRDFDADRSDVTKLIDDADRLIESNRERKLDAKEQDAPRPPDFAAKPADSLLKPMDDGDRSAPVRPKRRRRIGLGAGFALGLVLFSAGFAAYGPRGLRLGADAPRRAPAIAGTLRVADLAAGHLIKPGDVYAIDVPADTVRIKALSGRVALVARSGASLGPCSDRPLTIEIKHGALSSANPLVSACGREPSLIQAVIPQPALPSPVPAPSISPSQIKEQGRD